MVILDFLYNDAQLYPYPYSLPTIASHCIDDVPLHTIGTGHVDLQMPDGDPALCGRLTVLVFPRVE